MQPSYCTTGSWIKFWNTSPYLSSFEYLLYLLQKMVHEIVLSGVSRWKERHHEVNDQDEFLHDGFVIYSNEDRQWVHGTLREELEDIRNFELFIYTRDMLGGGAIANRILEGMAQCGKLIRFCRQSFWSASIISLRHTLSTISSWRGRSHQT